MTCRMIARRDVLKPAASGGLALLSGAGQRVWASNSSQEYPFSLGVASGDPWPDGFVLWTRLAPAPPASLKLGWSLGTRCTSRRKG